MERPLTIFIVGTTAVGKTRLSLALCKALNGQIISCDSKQLYRHANLLTAKATQQQKAIVKHHLIDCLNLDQAAYNRNKYYMEAIKRINDVRERGKIPVIIGGTNYYLETLLYNIDIAEDREQEEQDKPPKKNEDGLEKMKLMTPEQKYDQLKDIDPKMAQKLHLNDHMRVNNFLESYYTTGTVPSSVYKPYTQELRNPATILFWIKNSMQEEQRSLIAKRVKAMVGDQGIREILSIFTYLRNNGIQEAGVTQTIGYKEFEEFYQTVQKQLPSDLNSYQQIYDQIGQQLKSLKIEQKVLQRCTDLLSTRTVSYAKRQVTWIKNRIFQGKHLENFFTLELKGEGTLEDRFINQVQHRSLQIVEMIQKQGFGSVREGKESFREVFDSFESWKKYDCSLCEHTANGQHEWDDHLKSRRHRLNSKRLQKSKKRKEGENEKEKEQNQQENEQQIEKKQDRQEDSPKQAGIEINPKQEERQSHLDC